MAERPYHHGDLKNALVAAGIEILETEGLAALSLRAIAARVGVSHAAPRNHFGSLGGLLTAIAAEGFRRHAAAMRRGLDGRSTRDDRLRAAITGYAAFAAGHPALFTLMFSPDHCALDDPALAEAAADSYAVLREISTGLDWDKGEGPGGQQRTEMMLWSFVHGYATLANAGLFAAGGHGAPAFDVLAVMPAFGYRRPGSDPGPEPDSDPGPGAAGGASAPAAG
jgi:AcrR family transcriptional regulator